MTKIPHEHMQGVCVTRDMTHGGMQCMEKEDNAYPGQIRAPV